VMMSIAVPSFRNYQMTSKRAEAFANLAVLASAEKSHHSEYGEFINVLAQPMCGSSDSCDSGDGLGPDGEKHDSTFVREAFGGLGWQPDGGVFFSDDVVTEDSTGSSCGDCSGGCFTAAAYGDLDVDGQVSVMLYAHPDVDGNVCDVWLTGNGPPVDEDGKPMLRQVARSNVDDRY
jgi:hypothetical protein